MESNKGFTLVEAIMTMVIIAVIALTSAGLLIYFAQNMIFIPKKLSVDMVGGDILDMMVEGDTQAKGLRFATEIVTAKKRRVKFTDPDGKIVRFRVNKDNKKAYRKIDGTETVIPYYFPAGMKVKGKNNIVFKYYDSDENLLATPVADPSSIRRIEMTLIVKTGTGKYEDWEGKIQLGTSVFVRQ